MIKVFSAIVLYFFRIKFFFRKFNIGYKNSDLVLDVGSGNDPHPRADLLVDFAQKNYSRPFGLVKDERPFIVADIHALPFKSKIIDFVVCSQVLEHVDDPAKAVSELARIGRGGYIELPSVYFQKLADIAHHKWFTGTCDEGILFMRKKSPCFDIMLAKFFFEVGDVKKDTLYRAWYYSIGGNVVAYKWKDRIGCRIQDCPESDIDYSAFQRGLEEERGIEPKLENRFKVLFKNILKSYFGFRTGRRNKIAKSLQNGEVVNG